jgi:hypothetical protein
MDKKLDGQRQVEEVDAGQWLREFSRAYGQLPPERRAYVVVKSFMRMESPSEAQYRRFIDWLIDERNAVEKESAMERVVDEMLSGKL